jgi:hypothetical protein
MDERVAVLLVVVHDSSLADAQKKSSAPAAVYRVVLLLSRKQRGVDRTETLMKQFAAVRFRATGFLPFALEHWFVTES